MATREDLNAVFCTLLGTDNVYFQPPENLRIQYPCIIYSLDEFYEPKADNITYHRRRRYKVTYITSDPDDPMIEAIDDLHYCRMNRPFVAENLHHYPYTLYY